MARPACDASNVGTNIKDWVTTEDAFIFLYRLLQDQDQASKAHWLSAGAQSPLSQVFKDFSIDTRKLGALWEDHWQADMRKRWWELMVSKTSLPTPAS